MNNLTSRANVILANSLSVLGICTGLLVITTLHIPVVPKFDVKVTFLCLYRMSISGVYIGCLYRMSTQQI